MNKYEAIPQEMKALPNWVCFKLLPRKGSSGKMNKVPCDATGKALQWKTPKNLLTFNEAANNRRNLGIGFVFDNSPFVGIDIDDCISPGGQWSPLAAEIMPMLDSYTEVSVSGTGVHIICKGTLPDYCKTAKEKGRKIDRIGLEVYESGRFFALTGNIITQYSRRAEDRTDILKAVCDKYVQPYVSRPPVPPKTATTDDLSDEGLCNKIRKSKQGAKFSRLWDGDLSDVPRKDNGEPDYSRADLALCNILAAWTNKDAARIDRMFRQSSLYCRDKWDRADYRENTIQKAIADVTWTYDPEYYGKQLIKRVEKTEEELKELVYFPCTDPGNAERIMFLHGDKIRYCARYEKWFLYNGKKWTESEESALYIVAVDTMRLSGSKVKDVYPGRNADENKQRDRLEKFFRLSENMSRIRHMLEYVTALASISADEFDTDAWLLNCQNGVLDLKTGRLLPHDKKYMMTRICRAGYEAQNSPNLWEKTVSEIIPDEDLRRYLQKFVGYSLTGSVREEKLLVLYGQGGGGKGTFIETIGQALGDYADTIPVDVLLSAHNDSTTGNEPTPELAKLSGVRMALSSETKKGRKFNDAKIKHITGGDIISARRLRCEPFSYKPNFKLILSSNYLPAVTDTTDNGIKRRLVIAPFTAKLESIKDMTLKDKLAQPENLAAVLAWCVQGCVMWQNDGNLDKLPKAIAKMHSDYYEDNDLIGMFIEEDCVVGNDHRIKVKALCQAFNLWADDGSRYRKTGIKGFSDAMRARGFEKRRFKDGYHFIGINLKNPIW